MLDLSEGKALTRRVIRGNESLILRLVDFKVACDCPWERLGTSHAGLRRAGEVIIARRIARCRTVLAGVLAREKWPYELRRDIGKMLSAIRHFAYFGSRYELSGVELTEWRRHARIE